MQQKTNDNCACSLSSLRDSLGITAASAGTISCVQELQLTQQISFPALRSSYRHSRFHFPHSGVRTDTADSISRVPELLLIPSERTLEDLKRLPEKQ